MTPLLRALADRTLIFHAADYDLRMLRSSFGFHPAGRILDTMIAARLLGYREVGLAALLQRFFGVSLGKGGQRSDWSRRPLTPSQLDYAANDTRFLEPLADHLFAELPRMGRMPWYEESCARMVEATARVTRVDLDMVWRIKGTGRLKRRQAAMVRELWFWRDGEASRTDRPAFHVMGADQMLELALWADAHPHLSPAGGFRLPRNCRDQRLHALVEAVERARRMPQAEWPEPLPRRAAQPPPPRVEDLRAAAAGVAGRLGIEPAVLAPRAALEAVARARPRNAEEIVACSPLMHWQAELLEPVVRSVLHGEP
jgi:ribonuclease D